MIGLEIGPYTITAKLGEGGMGEVYRARDNKLGRDVALKVLPAAFARDPDRLARFEREARTLATLNHPHIAQIYGFEQVAATRLRWSWSSSTGTTYRNACCAARYRSTRRSRLRGSSPRRSRRRTSSASCIAISSRRTSRSRAAGTVKILDFGLAKAVDTAAGRPSTAVSAAITSPAMTEAGIILGTAAYMSPEQARGQRVDKRTDIWAFGVVVLEMLTGQRMFGGDTVSDAIAAVLTQEPDWSTLPAATPPRVTDLIRRCLRKDPKRRLRDIGDAVSSSMTRGERTPAAAADRSRRGAHPTDAAAVGDRCGRGPRGGGGLLVVAPRACARARRPRSIARVSLPLPPGATMFLGRGSSVAISPDGTRVVFTATDKARTQLYVARARSDRTASPLPGTDGAANPFFSPDGQWVGFTADGKLKKINLQGRTVVTITDAPNLRGEAWAPDDTILFTPNNGSALSQVPAGGGTAAAVYLARRRRAQSSLAAGRAERPRDGLHDLERHRLRRRAHRGAAAGRQPSARS